MQPGIGHAGTIQIICDVKNKKEGKQANRDLAPSGINLAWKFGRELDGRAVNGALVLIHLRGECRSGAPVPHPSSGSPTLGQTHIADGRILPIADVLCDAIRNLIDRDLRAALPGDSEVLLGRALGRVTAHELFHILLQTTTHSRDGLARAAQSASELLAPRSSFTRLDQRKIAQFSLATGDSP